MTITKDHFRVDTDTGAVYEGYGDCYVYCGHMLPGEMVEDTFIRLGRELAMAMEIDSNSVYDTLDTE